MTKSYGCFLNWWYPQIIHFNGVFRYKPSILGVFPLFFGNTHIRVHHGPSKWSIFQPESREGSQIPSEEGQNRWLANTNFGGLVKGPKINQYVGTVSHLLFNYCNSNIQHLCSLLTQLEILFCQDFLLAFTEVFTFSIVHFGMTSTYKYLLAGKKQNSQMVFTIRRDTVSSFLSSLPGGRPVLIWKKSTWYNWCLYHKPL